MNIYDIAKMAGVSIATVSRVVNGSDKVSEKTKQKVMNIIEESGYTPNVFAQGLGLNTMHTIGILVPDISDLYMSAAVASLEERLHKYGYDCILSCSGFHLEEKGKHVQMLLSKRIDGLVLVGSTYAGSGENSHETDYIREAATQVPVFLINGAVSGENVYCSVCDDSKATYDVTMAMIKKGKKRILFMTDSGSYSARQKMEGYERALNDAGMPVLGELKIKVKPDIHQVRDLLLQYRNLEFDGCIATSDEMAVGALKYAAVKGIKVPEELEVAGYNNSALSRCCEPELTSIDNRVTQVCYDTIDHLCTVLNKNGEVEKNMIVPCTLVKRCTTDF